MATPNKKKPMLHLKTSTHNIITTGKVERSNSSCSTSSSSVSPQSPTLFHISSFPTPLIVDKNTLNDFWDTSSSPTIESIAEKNISPSKKNGEDHMATKDLHRQGVITGNLPKRNRIVSLFKPVDQSLIHHQQQKRIVSTPVPKHEPLISNSSSSTPSPTVSTSKTTLDSKNLSNGALKQSQTAPLNTYTIKCLDGVERTWSVNKVIGKGSFGTVYLAGTYDSSNTLISESAIKITIKPHPYVFNLLQREVEILSKLPKHPSIIPIYGVLLTLEKHITIMKYCPGGDLFELASKFRPLIKYYFLKRIFKELASAVLFLHENWIIHRDIKLENVLLNISGEKLLSYSKSHLEKHAPTIITLTDFGLAKSISPDNYMVETRCGSEDYVAPELLMGQKYDGRQTDTWALGVFLYALMEGRLPFDPPPPTIDLITGTLRAPRIKTKTTHRIAHIDWAWYYFKNENGISGSFPNKSEVKLSDDNEDTDMDLTDDGSQILDVSKTQIIATPTTSAGSSFDFGIGNTKTRASNTTINNNGSNVSKPKYINEIWGPAKEVVENTICKRDRRWTSKQVLESEWCQV